MEDEEPFVHVRAISILSDLMDLHGEETIRRVSERYLVLLDARLAESGGPDTGEEVGKGDEGKVLRMGEALYGCLKRSDRADKGSKGLRDRLKVRMEDKRLKGNMRISIEALLSCID